MTDTMEFSSFRLDPVNQCLWWVTDGEGDTRLDLMPKTFDVLRYLVENSGRLITHGELLDALWPDVHVQPEVLKSHILAVRNALGDTAKSPRFVETLRGRGYRFIAPVERGNGIDHEPPSPLPRGVFVGRTEPLRQLRTLFRHALEGAPQIGFVVGEAGLGKTALVDQFVDCTAGIEGILLSRGRCVEGFGGTEPYYPVLEALGRLCKGPAGEAVLQALIALAPTWAVQLPGQISAERRVLLQRQIVGAARDRMLREICELLEALTINRPLLLVLEDLHWADYSTVDFVSALARRKSRAKLMVIVTYRPEEDDGGRHPLKRISHDLFLRKLCSEIAIEPLAEDAVAAFLTGSAETDPMSKEFAHLIRERSGGNPLFMQAMLDDLVERGLVHRTVRGWQLRTSPREIGFDVPRTLGQVIEALIQRLTVEQQHLLEVASVAGMRFSAATVADAAGIDPQSFEDICESLSRREFLIRREDTQVLADNSLVRIYGFNHALYRQVFYDRQGPSRLAQAHRRIGERMELLFPPDQRGDIIVALEQHFAAARDWPRALGYLRLALQTATRRFAHRDALAILDHATAVVENLPDDTQVIAEIEILERRAAIYTAAHDPRAEATYAQVAAKAAHHGQIDVQIRSLLGLAHTASWRDQARCLGLIDEVLQLSTRQTDPDLRAVTLVTAYVRRIWAAGWNHGDARACKQALIALEKANDPLLAARGRLDYSMVLIVSARYRDAHDTVCANYQALLDLAENRAQFNLTRAIWMHQLGVPWSLLFLGEFGNSLAAFDAGIATLTKNGNYAGAHALQLYRSLLLFHTMDFPGIIEVCGKITLPTDETSDQTAFVTALLLPLEQRLRLVLLGLAEAGLGNSAAALDHLVEAERLMDAQPVLLDWYWRLMLEGGRVNLLIAAGDPVAAKARAERFVDLAERTEERTWQALAWEAKARAVLGLGQAAEALVCIGKASAATVGFETPLADWRVHETAAAAYCATGDARSAATRAELGVAQKQRLAESLPRGHRLRMAFEASTWGR